MSKILLSILFGVILTSAFSQQVITAKIIDKETNAAVPNAVITVEGDTTRFVSNKLGFFQLTANKKEYIIISHDDYETGKIRVPDRSSFAIQLIPLDKSTVRVVDNNFEKGQIVDDYKTGVWEYYESNKIAMKLDYDRNEIVYLAPDTSEYAVKIDDRFVMRKVDRQPRYLGPVREIYQAIASTIPYPVEARSKGIQGRFEVAFTIDVQGRMKDFQVMNDIGGGCGEAAVQALKQIPNIWIPALIDGSPYPTRFVMPFNFMIRSPKTEDPTTTVETLNITATYLTEFMVTTL